MKKLSDSYEQTEEISETEETFDEESSEISEPLQIQVSKKDQIQHNF